jgi:pantoate--beta-alanine ligase
MTQPDVAYFGEKDFQQVAVIRAMVADLKLPIKLVACPIVREESGLAMSSRNTLLTSEERITALNISRCLFESLEYAKSHTVCETQKKVVDELNAIEGLDVEYYHIVNGITLQEVASWDEAEEVVGCITVFCGARPVRLIDNIRYK